MIIEYKNGDMIVTHESGHVDTYNIEHIEKFKSNIVKTITRRQETEAGIDEHLEAMNASKISEPI